jgi:hypothetical protein
MKLDALAKVDAGFDRQAGFGDAQSDAQAASDALSAVIADLQAKVAAGGLATAGLASDVAQLSSLVGDLLTKQRILIQSALPASTSAPQPTQASIVTSSSGNVSSGVAAFIAVGSGVLGGIVGYAVRDKLKR